MSCRYFIAFAVLLAHGTLFQALGQSTVEGYDNGDPSISIFQEIQQMRLLLEAFLKINEQVQVQQKLQSASFQQMLSQINSNTGSLEAVDRRLQDHDIYIKSQTDINMRSLQGVDRSLQNHDDSIKNQTDIIMRSLQAVDRRLQDHDSYIKRGREDVTVFQRRKDGSVDFYRTWNEYKEGFGDLNGEFWLGNEMLYLLTSKRTYKLRIDLEDFEGRRRFAEYANFSISSSADNYRISVSGYYGDAGDSLAIHNGQQFTTKDVDNDSKGGSNCAQTYRGGWWYNVCHQCNLNGIYRRGNYEESAQREEGVVWYHWLGHWYSLKATEMKLVPVA